MTFPDTYLRLKVEWFLKGQWVVMSEVTAVADDFYTDEYLDVYLGSIVFDRRRLLDQDLSISRGRFDEASAHSPASFSVLLDNRDGVLSPFDPRSPWFPDIRVGTDLRVTVEDIPSVVFYGQVAEIRPTWPYGDLSTGTEVTVDGETVTVGGEEVTVGARDFGESFVTVTAAGELRRLGQAEPLRSPLYRLITRAGNREHVDGYWPMEDGEYATSALPAIGATPLNLTAFNYARDGFVPGSEPLPQASTFGEWNAAADGSTSEWAVELQFKLTEPTSGQECYLLRVDTSGALAHIWVRTYYDSGDSAVYLTFFAYDASWALIDQFEYLATSDIFDTHVHLRLEVTPDGGDTVIRFSTWANPPDGLYRADELTVSAAVGRVVNLSGRVDGPTLSLGHVVVHDKVVEGWLIQGVAGWLGETALARLVRLASEEGLHLAFEVDESMAEGMPLGIQGPKPLLTLLQEAADADGGVLCERITSRGLRYISRMARYNRAVTWTLDANDSDIANPFEPVHDDQGLANDVTVVREGGGQTRLTDENHIDLYGKYETSTTLSLAEDDLTVDAAGWWLHVGTWEGLRYPQVTVDFAVRPDLLEMVPLVGPGFRIQIVGLPPQHPLGVVDLVVQGWTDDINPHSWRRTFNCTPAGPWTVFQIEDDLLGRLDTAGSVLADDSDEDEPEMTVTSTDGATWITTATRPQDFPFDIEINGEVITVTGITGDTATQTFAVIRGVNGVTKTHSAGDPVSLADQPVVAR